MTPTTYFGRAKHDGASLGADFDLLAKWTRAFSLGHPIHSYYLTQLSSDDRTQLFTGPAQEFLLEEGPGNTVKLETLQDEVDRIDPDVVAMIQSANYQRSEARQLELRNEVEDAHHEAEGAAALALCNALLAGMDGPPAEGLAKQVSNKVLDSAVIRVKGRWKAARSERLMSSASDSPSSPEPEPSAGASSKPVDCTDDTTPWWRSAASPRQPGETQFADTISHASISPTIHPDNAASNGSRISPQLKHAAAGLMSPQGSVPDYGSETSSDSAQWNSPRCSADESPSSPDLDSVADLEDSTGGVALLPESLVKELGLKDESDATTPTPTSSHVHPQTQVNGGHLGAGLSQALFAIPGANAPSTDNVYDPVKRRAVLAGFRADHNRLVEQLMGKKPRTPVEASLAAPVPAPAPVPALVSTPVPAPAPFSPDLLPSGHPVAKEQPWMGFTCYEVATKFGNDRLVPKYWTTKRGKERYVRHKIGDLKLDDAKLRSERFSGSVARNPIHVFIDLSNIIIGFYDSMKESRGMPVNKRVMAPPFSFKNFDTILTRDRNVAKRILAGSMANSYNKRRPGYMVQAQELKYEMNILERVPKPASPVRKRKSKAGNRDLDAPTSGADTSGEDCFLGPMKQGEQGVDELLHLKILQSAMDTARPATLVLATGDAATAQYSDGFKKNIERVLAHGWNIELYGWSRNISSAWREPEFVEQWGHQFKVVELDGFCEELFDMTIESLEQ